MPADARDLLAAGLFEGLLELRFALLVVQNTREDELLLEIYSITGQLVLSGTLAREPLHIKKIALQSGLYTARVTGGNETETVKIIVR